MEAGSASQPAVVGPTDTEPASLRIAIIGGGIAGINLALGLEARGLSNYTLFERASAFGETGAGIGFSPNAERAMERLGPGLAAAYRAVANPNGEDYFQWVDGLRDELMHRLHVGENGFLACKRSDYLDAMAALVPAAKVRFGAEVDTVHQPAGDGDGDSDRRVRLTFRDGSEDTADVVVGCDGVNSRVRALVLGHDALAARPAYSHKFCFRALVPMDRARAAVGEQRASTRFMFNGPGAHAITYPVAMNALLNVLVVVSDPDPWPHARHTALGSRAEAEAALAGWHPSVRALVDLLPEAMEKWAIFDMADQPATRYVSGCVGLAGDAAHTTGPHLGAGAGMGIEDALLLASLLELVAGTVQQGSDGGRVTTAHACRAALDVYNELRYDRTQAVVANSRKAVDLFQWRRGESADPSDPAVFAPAITSYFHDIWHYDVDGMVTDGLAKLSAKLALPKALA